MNKFEDLKVWKKSINMVKTVYQVTQSFPEEEKFGLTQQIRRAAVSVPSNIAEGSGMNSKKAFINFLSIANGSASELKTQLIIASELGYMQKNRLAALVEQLDEIQKMNFALQKYNRD